MYRWSIKYRLVSFELILDAIMQLITIFLAWSRASAYMIIRVGVLVFCSVNVPAGF
nr:MAG TPA: hypothetical protein [Caudoviricetes sp.]